MFEYGITPKGVVIKRLDKIIDELHSDLSGGWGVNTRLNPKSYLNVQLTAFADKIAELWEFGEEVYHSMYPFSAEGASLDNAVQYGGISREDARPTYYPIHCECVDGTIIPKGALIKTATNPTVQFRSASESAVTRNSFNIVKVKVAVVQPEAVYTVALNGTLYSYSGGETEVEILAGLAATITDKDFAVSVTDNLLLITSLDPDKQIPDYQKTSQLVLSGNLTTASVTGIVNFASEVNGEISLPNGTITQIVTTIPGLLSVANNLPYIAGRVIQDDIGLRKSYADKIFARSNRMLESIKSAILLNVQGISSITAYQNDTNIVDADGRSPHCVEIVVDGGSDMDIALQIWDKKTDGIQTFGNTEVIVPGDEGEPITIRFNRPMYVYVWFSVTITMNQMEQLPPNYVDAIQSTIVEEMAKIEAGKPIIPQRLIDSKIYGNVPGIAYIDTKTFYTTDSNQQPEQYLNGMVPITPRQRAVTEKSRIEVILSG